MKYPKRSFLSKCLPQNCILWNPKSTDIHSFTLQSFWGQQLLPGGQSKSKKKSELLQRWPEWSLFSCVQDFWNNFSKDKGIYTYASSLTIWDPLLPMISAIVHSISPISSCWSLLPFGLSISNTFWSRISSTHMLFQFSLDIPIYLWLSSLSYRKFQVLDLFEIIIHHDRFCEFWVEIVLDHLCASDFYPSLGTRVFQIDKYLRIRLGSQVQIDQLAKEVVNTFPSPPTHWQLMWSSTFVRGTAPCAMVLCWLRLVFFYLTSEVFKSLAGVPVAGATLLYDELRWGSIW